MRKNTLWSFLKITTHCLDLKFYGVLWVWTCPWYQIWSLFVHEKIVLIKNWNGFSKKQHMHWIQKLFQGMPLTPEKKQKIQLWLQNSWILHSASFERNALHKGTKLLLTFSSAQKTSKLLFQSKLTKIYSTVLLKKTNELFYIHVSHYIYVTAYHINNIPALKEGKKPSVPEKMHLNTKLIK